MKIIENNYTKPLDPPKVDKPKTYRVRCEWCGSVIEAEDSDLFPIDTGCVGFNCPCCNKRSMADNITEHITYSMIKYPDNFWLYTHNTDTPDIKLLERSEHYISKAIETLYYELSKIELPEDYENEIGRRYWMGDTILIMFKYRNDCESEVKEGIEYLYDIQIVKPLADAEITDLHKRFYEEE